MKMSEAIKFLSVLSMSIMTSVMVLDTQAAGSAKARAAFSKGSTTFNVVAGSGSAFNDTYVILGLGLSYYVMDGLEIGIDAQHWFSGDPSISKVSPQIRYVLTKPEIIKPYIRAGHALELVSAVDVYILS